MQTQPRSTFVGGRLCLDFTNTVATHDGASPYDRIASPGSLVAWLAEAGVVTAARAAALAREAKLQPTSADAACRRARRLRHACYRIFSAIARGAAPPPSEVAGLNSILVRATCGARVARRKSSFEWEWAGGTQLAETALWPIARSSADLLVSDDLARVTECGGSTCSWLFVDTTKNRSRKFCSSAGCGNRTRVRRYYERIHRT